ncbi:hypothetical protein [Streptomyces sp. NPDC048481]|uniref:hypothetical protein n=1 Tax=Streptomyces sp. NPDC048481 TaxID=3365557 RepID=UPI0037161DD9
MGERLNDGTGHGRRRARPDDALAAPPGVEELLARALRAPAVRPRKGDDGDAGGEETDGVEVSVGERRAVAAFRAARDARHARAGRVRPRRRDDWRPRARRHTARSLRVTLCALIAGITLGGAAFAAIDSGTDDDGIGVGAGVVRGGEGRPRQSAGAAADPSGALSAVPSATDGADRDRPAKGGSDEDAAARCRAYEKAHGRGERLGPADWRRLVAAAGGEKNVEAYCAAPGRRAPAAKGGPAGEAGRTGAAGGSDPAGTPGGTEETGGGTGRAGGTGNSGGAAGGTGKSGGAAARPDGTARPVPRARPGEATTTRR